MNNDLISRKYMREAIDQFFVREKYYHPYSKGRKTIPTEEVLDIIDNAPTVETPCEQESELIKAYTKGFNTGVEIVKNARLQGEWEDYDNTFYKCPDCGYLLEKCCPQCQNKVILPKGGAE